MKIFILTNSSKGLFSFRRELIETLIKRNSIYVYTPDNGSVPLIRELGCKIFDLPVDRRGLNLKKDFMLFRKIWKNIKRENPDLVITYTIKPNIYGGLACRLRKISYVVNITGLGTAFQKRGLLRWIVTILYRLSLKDAKTVFFENEENRQIFVKEGIVSEEKTCLLMGAGVNLNRYQVSDYPAGKTTKFLFMGRVMKEKGIDELFQAMHKLTENGFDCSLDVLGSYEEDYKKIIEKYEAEGWLNYHGYQTDVIPFISATHCLVLPSWHEGMANTNLESAASGRPIITSNIHGCLEAVEDGVSGYLVEKKDIDDLYKSMKKFIGLSYEERKKMGLAGRKRMEKYFDKKIVVEKTISRL